MIHLLREEGKGKNIDFLLYVCRSARIGYFRTGVKIITLVH